MNEPKEALALYIDAFAAAKVSSNELLIKLALGQLQDFINSHDITLIESNE